MNIEIISADITSILKGLKVEWEKAGHFVNQITTLTDTEYHYKRSRKWSRYGLRWEIYGYFPLKLFWQLRRKNEPPVDFRVLVTSPFYLPALAQWLSKSNKSYTINLLYDLFPEAIIQAKILRADSLIVKYMESLMRYSLKNCSATVFFGEYMRDYTESRYGRAQHSVVIPCGSDGTPFRNNPPEPIMDNEEITILYSGSIGYMHDIDTLLKLFDQKLPKCIKFVFHSGGVGYSKFKKEVAMSGFNFNNRLILSGPLSEQDWPHVMRNSQIGLVTLAHGAENVCFPSKIYSALVSGQAVLAICNKKSDLAQVVLKHDCGWVVEPGDIGTIVKVLDKICKNRDEIYQKRLNAFKVGHKYYDISSVAKQFIKLFNELLTK